VTLDEAREAWHRAVERDKPHDAVRALAELEKLEPREPRWSQRLGEAYRRVDKTRDAAQAFARAFERYHALGFLPRAIAMAKLAGALDPAHGGLLAAAVPQAAPPTPRVVRPLPLEPARDSKPDEIRFRDEPESSIDILLEDVSLSEADLVEIDDDPPPMRGVAGTEGGDAYAAMASFRLFAALPRAALLDLAEAAELVEFDRGAMITMRDEKAFALYAIVGGRAAVHVPGSPDIRLVEGDVFGEASLLDEGTRQADVRADTALMTLRIDKRSLQAIAARHPEVEDVLFDVLARRLVTNLMHVSPIFTPFEPASRLELAQRFEVRRAAPGTVLAERGRRSDGLYVLLAGHVVAESPGSARVRIARGTPFGHASLLGVAAESTLRAMTETVLLRLPGAGFATLAAQYPPVLAHLAETASEPLPISERTP